jgi:predicted MFS family arabinose efflux permease
MRLTTGTEEGQGTVEPTTGGGVPPQPMTPDAGRHTARPSMKEAFASFGHRNYRLWFTGQAASLVGTWMQLTAQGFLVFQLTHSPAFLGYVGFASGAPIWLFTLFGGVISDRVPLRNLLVMTQTTMMILAFILAALTFFGHIQPWHIVLLALGLGMANAFDGPARQAFVVELVEREDLGNAIALNSTIFNLGSAIGPAIAGVVYAALGPGWCFTINGGSFIAVISALLMMRLKVQPRRVRTGTALDDLKDGLRYVVSHPTIRMLILITTMTTIFGMSFFVLLPAWSVKILGGDSTTNGFLHSARGVGSLMGALMIASFGRASIKGKLLTVGSLIFPVLLLAWAAMRWLPLSLLMLVGVGWGTMLVLNIANILGQLHVPDQLRGRVMSLYTLSFFGIFPLGALLSGTVAEVIGEPTTVALGALVMLAFAGFLWLRMPHLRSLE